MNASAAIRSARHDFLQLFGKVASLFDIVDAYRVGDFILRLPWRVAVDGFAIFIRESAPSHKAHHIGLVEQKDRRAVAAQYSENGVQAGLVNVVARSGRGKARP